MQPRQREAAATPDTPPTRAVLTLATGKPIYTQLAVNLARSFLYWHQGRGPRFTIATDRSADIPGDVADNVDVISLAPGQYGDGFSPKLHLDRLAPAAQTMFIDADSLCAGNIEHCFDRFTGQPVATIAGRIARGEWFGDVASVCSRFGIESLPKFNGGVYYIERGPRATAVYETARSLEPHYDEIGLVRLRGKPNEELLMAIAMAIHGLSGIPEDGKIMAEPLNFACGMKLDVLRGEARLLNVPGHPRYQANWPLTEARPRIVHFLGCHTDGLPYTAEAVRLEKVMAKRWPRWAADAFAYTTRTVPQQMASEAKRLLRPAYHALFGYRPVSVSNRV